MPDVMSTADLYMQVAQHVPNPHVIRHVAPHVAPPAQPQIIQTGISYMDAFLTAAATFVVGSLIGYWMGATGITNAITEIKNDITGVKTDVQNLKAKIEPTTTVTKVTSSVPVIPAA